MLTYCRGILPSVPNLPTMVLQFRSQQGLLPCATRKARLAATALSVQLGSAPQVCICNHSQPHSPPHRSAAGAALPLPLLLLLLLL